MFFLLGCNLQSVVVGITIYGSGGGRVHLLSISLYFGISYKACTEYFTSSIMTF